MEQIVIKPKKFILIPTGTYNKQYFRPFRTNVNDYLIRALYEKTRGGTNLNPTVIAGLAGNILSPSTKPTAESTIKHGWGSRRYRFLMVLEVLSNKNLYIQIATGYTDYMRSTKKHLDPEMEVYFNSFQTFTRKLTVTPEGPKSIMIPYDVTQLINIKNKSPMGAFRYDHMNPMLEQQLLRPQDVFNRLTMNMISTGLDYDNNSIKASPMPYSTAVDTRSAAEGQLSTSNRKNGNSASYISSVLSGLKNAKEAYADTNKCNIYGQAAVSKEVTDKHVSENQTLYKFCTTFSDFTQRGYLKLKELQAVIPGLDHVTQFMGMSQVKKIRMPHEAGDTEPLSNISKESHAAAVLANALPDLMIDSLLGQINFIATNNYADGLIRFTWVDKDAAKSLVDGIDAYINKFVHRLTNEVLYDLCHQGAVRFNLSVFADITDDIKITIGFDGSNPEPYVMPIFCDSIFSPVIGKDGEALAELSTDMETLATNICGDT